MQGDGHVKEALLVVYELVISGRHGTFEPYIECEIFTRVLDAVEIFLRKSVYSLNRLRTLKSLTEQGGQVRPSKINCNCNPSGMPALELVLSEYCDELVLRIEGGLCAFGLAYQISSNLGAIAIEQRTKQNFG